MLTHRVIPCLDVRDGRVVKGVQFSGLRDAGDPVALASAYQDQGADELVVLDVTATLQGRLARLDTIRRIRDVLSIPLTVGGGVRGIADAIELLEAGADKVSLNSAAVESPDLLAALAERFGRQCVVLALDAAQQPSQTSTWEVVTHSGRTRTGLDAVHWATSATQAGAGEILLTSFDRDGTGAGYDLPLIRAISSAVNVPIIASGGANGPVHMLQAFQAGADAVLAASIFHDGHTTVSDVKAALASGGALVRLDRHEPAFAAPFSSLAQGSRS